MGDGDCRAMGASGVCGVSSLRGEWSSPLLRRAVSGWLAGSRGGRADRAVCWRFGLVAARGASGTRRGVGRFERPLLLLCSPRSSCCSLVALSLPVYGFHLGR